MVNFKLSPYAQIIESRLSKQTIQYGLFHLLTGELIELSEDLRVKLLDPKLYDARFRNVIPPHHFQELLNRQFIISEDQDPLSPFLGFFAVRPLQNPALGYQTEDGRVIVARTSMSEYIFGRKKGDLPLVIEEELSPTAASIFAKADGTSTLAQLLDPTTASSVSTEAREAIEFLTTLDRQLIKLAPFQNNLSHPLIPCNIIGRNLLHAADSEQASSNTEFHLHGIEDASWEFERIEPTVNYAFRFPSDVFGGLSYGERFCRSALEIGVLSKGSSPSILEIGGGTGTFAKSFLTELKRNEIDADYHILDLSPVLIEHQRQVLTSAGLTVTHHHADATQLELDRHFDLILANEVIADFPVSEVQTVRLANQAKRFEGNGAQWVDKYQLDHPNAPERFLINSGVFEFLERAWRHLSPGGSMILTEYGSEHAYPIQAFQLNHEEFSIHFGHVRTCSEQIGFRSKLITLGEFLKADNQTLIFDGREDRILCLNHILQSRGHGPMFYAAYSRREFEIAFGEATRKLGLIGVSFSPLQGGFHFTPEIEAFLTLVNTKPSSV